jgi:hypothetical protein
MPRWSREEPQFFNAFELDWEAASDPRSLHSVESRLLSREQDGSGLSMMVKLEPGWKSVELAEDATIEFVVLEGDLLVGGERLRAGGFAYVPQGVGSVELSSDTGAQAIVFWNVDLPREHGTELTVRRVVDEPWNMSVMPTALHGAMHKSLRLPDAGDAELHGGPGGGVRVVILTPGFCDDREHVHSVWEEMLFLGGDLIMPERGILAPGSYLGNPADFWHAPMITQRSSFMLLQMTKPIDMEIREYPGGREMAEAYLDGASWLESGKHLEWDEIAQWHPPTQG